MDSLSLAHAKWKCQYHIVFIPKYRRKVIYGKIRVDVREAIIKLCAYKNIEIISGVVCIDHVYLCVSIPPKIAVSKFVGYLKGKSTLMIHDMHPDLYGKWDKAFWARGYFCGDSRKCNRRNNKEVHRRARSLRKNGRPTEKTVLLEASR